MGMTSRNVEQGSLMLTSCPHVSSQELPTASDSLFQFPRDPLDGGTDSSLLVPFSAAKRLGRYGSWYRAQNRKITVPPPMPKPNHSDSKRDLNSDTQRFDDATNEHRPTHITDSDHLSAMLFDIPDPDISLSSSATNESFSENLYDWLQTQGTQTQSNARNDYAHHTPPSPQACNTTGDTPISHRRALNGGFADHRSSQHSRPLSPPPTIRPRKTRFQALPSASVSPRLGGSQDEFASTAGLGLILPSHLDHDAGVSSLEDSRAANTEVFSSPPQIETKGRQHLSDGHPDVALSQSEDHAGRPLPTVLAHFMHVIAELKLKSTERCTGGTSPLSGKAGPWAVPSESPSDCGLPSDIADGVEDDRESVKKLAKRLLEQGLSQEEQSQKLRILAETLCEIALLRRTLSGMLSSKYGMKQ